MFSRDSDRQIIFRHSSGRRSGKQDTLSFKRFRLSEREWATVKRNVGRILEAQQLELPLVKQTADWLESIPRKQLKYLQERLLTLETNSLSESPANLRELIDDFEAYRQQLSTSLETDAAILRDVRKLQRCCSNARSIDEGMLADLLEELAEEYLYAENTLARHAKHWCTFFAWLMESQVVASNPCRQLNRTIGPRSKDSIRMEWIDDLVNQCSTAEERYWLRLVQWTGCRLREGLSLRVKDFDVERNRIYIQESKNDRVRVNPIYSAIAEYLPDLLKGRVDPDERILHRITSNNCYGWLYTLCERVGVPRWQPPYNAFRATRASQLAADPTITEQQAGMLLGHSPTVARRNYLSIEENLLVRLAS